MDRADIASCHLDRALFASEEKFRLLASTLHVHSISLMELDPEGHLTSWNESAARMTGYASAQIINSHFSIFYTPEDIALGSPNTDLKQAREENYFECESWRVRRDGSRLWAHVTMRPLKDLSGGLLGYLNVIRDITASKRFEERFRCVVESAPSAMVMINRTGTIEMVNTQAEQVFGYDRTEMLGKSVELLVPDRFRSQHPELRSQFFHSPQSRPMGAGRDLFGRRKDGSEFPIEIGLNPIETDQGQMVLSVIVDISARKKMEERFRLVVESAPNAMVMINSAGTIEMLNTQAEQVFGYSRAELLGQPVELLIPERFRGHHSGLRAGFLKSPQSRPMGAGRDLFGRRKDGSEFPIEIGLNPLETDEGPMVLSAVVDISDRKQKEEKIKAALEEKDILLSEIHHRVKNNLQIVHSLLDLQSDRIDDPFLLSILRDSQNRVHAMALIHQTLYQSNNFSKIDFTEVLTSLLPALIGSYGSNQSAISYTIDAEPVFLTINAAIPCGLIVNELITNSLKHAFVNRTQGALSLTLHQRDNLVSLAVSDDGVGISEDIDFSNTESLGLQLVTLLSSQLGADLSVQRSSPTTFSLRFSANR